MIKVFCDKCGKEITDNVNTIKEEAEAVSGGRVVGKFTSASYQYCDECMKNGLTCGFKIGDEVITSTGKVGTITDICTCDKCKEREFYEPVIEVEIGNGSIWITDNDKRVGFRSFYKIGNQVFGNLDEDDVLDEIKSTKEEVRKLQLKLIELDGQLNMINILKKKNKTIHNEEN